METIPEAARARGMSEFTWRHLVRTYGEEFAEICVLPDADYWRLVAERMQTQNTERDLINEIVPSEWAPTLHAAQQWAANLREGNDAEPASPAPTSSNRPTRAKDGSPHHERIFLQPSHPVSPAQASSA